MSFCRQCGREEVHDHCVCLQTNPIPRWQVWILYVVMLAVPVMSMSLVKGAQSIWDVDYLQIGGIVLSGIVLILTMLDLVLSRPYLALLFGCHQRLERSFTFHSKTLPLCARCTGIYVGIFLTSLIQIPFDFPVFVYPLLGLPLLIDGYLQHRQHIPSNNTRRFTTGMLFGPTLVFFFTMYHVLVIAAMEKLMLFIFH